MIKHATPKGQKELKINLDEFVKELNNKNAVLVDIRMPFEKKVWNIPFAIDIAPDEMEEKIDTLPKDKLIVCACPTNNRSPFVAGFLKEKGFNAKYLEEGLLEFMRQFRGGKAKDLKV